jgi:hypothetical protein
MFKKILVLFFVLFFASHTSALAQSEFKTDIAVSYNVNEAGVTTVTNDITLTNIFSTLLGFLKMVKIILWK